MKKVLVIAAIAIALTGCGRMDRMGASISGKGYEVCMDGVVYYQFTSGSSVAYNTDGTIKTC
jgi:hypothetical protein